MKKNKLFIILIFSITFCFSNVVGKISQKIISETIERAGKISGREYISSSSKKMVTETLEKLVKTHGDEAIKLVDDAGIELLEHFPQFGDELIEYSLRVSPKARRVLALNVNELLPLVRKVGVEALELEVKAPGLASRVFKVFGDDAGKIIAKNIPSEDIPRLLKYAEKADSPKTRKLLLESYKKEGHKLFNRIKPSHILVGGLTASMIYGTHRVTEPAVRLGELINENENISIKTIEYIIRYGYGIVFFLIFILFWRFNLMPWHRKKTNSNLNKSKNKKRKANGRNY